MPEEKGFEEPGHTLQLDLSTAREWELLLLYGEVVWGDFIMATTDGTLEGVKLRVGLNQGAGSDPHATYLLEQQNVIKRKFNYIWLYNTVQTGNTLYLSVGKSASAEASSTLSSKDLHHAQYGLGGTASSGSQTTLTDSAKNLSTDMYKNARIHIWIAGTEYVRGILSNTPTQFSFDALPSGVSPSSGDSYAIEG